MATSWKLWSSPRAQPPCATRAAFLLPLVHGKNHESFYFILLCLLPPSSLQKFFFFFFSSSPPSRKGLGRHRGKPKTSPCDGFMAKLTGSGLDKLVFHPAWCFRRVQTSSETACSHSKREGGCLFALFICSDTLDIYPSRQLSEIAGRRLRAPVGGHRVKGS